jgi:tetratricopeptide (TPR) repeat protein
MLDELDGAHRSDLHGAVALSLQERRPNAVEDLAYHFSAARIPDEACRYSTEAGRRAASLAAFETAARHFENAASWNLPDGRYELLADWEDTLEVLGRRATQHEVLDEMAELADSPLTHAETTRRRSRLLDLEGNHRDAVALAQQAVTEASDGDEHDRGRSLQTLGLVLSHSGAPLEAVPHLEAAVATFAGYPGEEASALCDLGNALCDSQEYGRAAEALTRALKAYEELDDPYGIAETSGQLAIIHMEQGEHELAVPLYERALDLARDLGYRRGEAVNLANLGSSRYHQGSIAEALELYDQAAVVFTAIGDRRGAALIRANTASVRFTILGDNTVEPVVRDSLEFFLDEGHDTGAAFCHEHLAAIAHRSGHLDEAQEHIATGLDLVAEGGHRWVEVHLRRLGARIALDAASMATARAHIDEARAICAELDLKDVAPSVEGLASSLALESGDPALALDLARGATTILEQGADEPHIVWYRRYAAAESAGEHDEARESLAEASRLLDALTDELPPDGYRSARTRVPDHRAIVAATEHTFATERTVTLPRIDVPLGRPVRDDEWIDLRWTVTDPSDSSIRNRGERRRRRLVRLAEQAEQQGGAPRVEDLAEALGASAATMRRDLASLRRSGIDITTRGSR